MKKLTGRVTKTNKQTNKKKPLSESTWLYQAGLVNLQNHFKFFVPKLAKSSPVRTIKSPESGTVFLLILLAFIDMVKFFFLLEWLIYFILKAKWEYYSPKMQNWSVGPLQQGLLVLSLSQSKILEIVQQHEQINMH